MWNPVRNAVERHRERVRSDAAHRERIRAGDEAARRQTRMATVMTGGDWPDGRWERTFWENGRPARTYRGTRTRTTLPPRVTRGR